MVEDQDDQEMTVKLIDFGFGSRILEGVKLRAKVGTFVYLGVPSGTNAPKTHRWAGENLPTWRIIPFSKWLVTPIYKPFRPFGRGITPFRGRTSHGY